MTEIKNLVAAYISFRKSLVRLAGKWVPPADVEDVVQETYVRICQIQHANAVQSPRSFMCRTVINLAKDQYRKADNRLVDNVESMDLLIPDTAEHQDKTLASAISNQEFGTFCEAVRLLPPQCRRAFVLKKVYGYTQKEIAQEMKISENTVENYIVNGMKKCSMYMGEYLQNNSSGKNSKRGVSVKTGGKSRG